MEETMSLRSSLSVVAATVCLATSFPASAALIEYVVDPGTNACYGQGPNPCGQSVSFNGSFTVDTDATDPNTGTPTLSFPQVDITVSNLEGNLLSAPLSLVGAFLPFEGDFINFIAFDPTIVLGAAGVNFVLGNTPLDKGGHIPLHLPIILDPQNNPLYFPAENGTGGFTAQSATPVPEPSSLMVMAGALGMLGFVGWRRKFR
jgi:hypothetical protein